MIRSLLKRTKFHRAALPLLAMLLTTTTAWADEVSVSNVNELSNAVMYGVTEDRTITLTGDNKEWTLTQTLGAWANYIITIDLNGHTITSESILYRGYNDTDLTIMDSKGGGSLVYTGGQLTSAIGVNSGGKLTIKSGEISSPNSLAIQNDGTLTITGGTINNSLYGIRNTGIANISNCTITCSEFSVFNDAVSNYIGIPYQEPNQESIADTYIVQKGDTLYSIAKKFEISVSDLMKSNSLSTNTLKIGQVLVIPRK